MVGLTLDVLFKENKRKRVREIRPEYVHRGQTYLTASHSPLPNFCYFFQLVGGMAKTMACLQAFPSSLFPCKWSRPLNYLPLTFRTPATQASSVSDYRLITCLLRTSLLRRGSRWVALIFPSSPARLLFSLSPTSLRHSEASAKERLKRD